MAVFDLLARLIMKMPYERKLLYIFWSALGTTFVASFVTIFVGCTPFARRWQIYPNPGNWYALAVFPSAPSLTTPQCHRQHLALHVRNLQHPHRRPPHGRPLLAHPLRQNPHHATPAHPLPLQHRRVPHRRLRHTHHPRIWLARPARPHALGLPRDPLRHHRRRHSKYLRAHAQPLRE